MNFPDNQTSQNTSSIFPAYFCGTTARRTVFSDGFVARIILKNKKKHTACSAWRRTITWEEVRESERSCQTVGRRRQEKQVCFKHHKPHNIDAAAPAQSLDCSTLTDNQWSSNAAVWHWKLQTGSGENTEERDLFRNVIKAEIIQLLLVLLINQHLYSGNNSRNRVHIKTNMLQI